MTQVPLTVWNQIAHEQPLLSQWALTMFNQPTPEALSQALAKESDWLTSQGHSARVISAYQQILPLLVEHHALTQFITSSEAYSLRTALPEVTTVAEALRLATQEFSLTDSESSELSQLLRKAVHLLVQKS
ncbi:hypothetical protein FAES_3293 [Fibrella aestuarina BUZ 2]|uniref:Uncharacterized protein n=1 Tax=Fibrella aestuarina BUZ 2 TaxID=1166018 RepID=I0KAZ8_9BACT|nr:hypothetical protein FAES_3293 [Fibrella aestuarina BUZ 2]